jgi:transposase
LAGVVVERIERSADGVGIAARPRSAAAVCPACGAASLRVHSRYERSLADVAVGGQRVVIRLRVRRFFCRQVACPTVTFAEQLTGLTQRYGRRTACYAACWNRSAWCWRAAQGPAWRAGSAWR